MQEGISYNQKPQQKHREDERARESRQGLHGGKKQQQQEQAKHHFRQTAETHQLCPIST